MGDFYGTQMGKNFYEGTMRKIEKDLNRQAKALEAQSDLLRELNGGLNALVSELRRINGSAQYPESERETGR